MGFCGWMWVSCGCIEMRNKSGRQDGRPCGVGRSLPTWQLPPGIHQKEAGTWKPPVPSRLRCARKQHWTRARNGKPRSTLIPSMPAQGKYVQVCTQALPSRCLGTCVLLGGKRLVLQARKLPVSEPLWVRLLLDRRQTAQAPVIRMYVDYVDSYVVDREHSRCNSSPEPELRSWRTR
jgi:hypothetical protein